MAINLAACEVARVLRDANYEDFTNISIQLESTLRDGVDGDAARRLHKWVTDTLAECDGPAE